MKVLGLILVSVTLVLGEPPVPSNKYLPVESLDTSLLGVKYADDSSQKDASDLQKLSPGIQYSTQYEIPSNQYLPSLEYSGLSSGYEISSSQDEGKTPKVEYGVPASQYKAPTTKYGSSLDYSGLSSGYELSSSQDDGKTPNVEYGVPASQYKAPTTKYGSSLDYSGLSSGYELSSSQDEGKTPNVEYGVPASQYKAPTTKYGSSLDYSGLSSGYELSSSQDEGKTPNVEYGVPASQYKAPTTKYGPPSSQIKTTSNQNTFSSSYSLPAVPSSNYGAPSSKYGQPLAKYEPHSEPANYEYKYQVEEEHNDFGHAEARQGDHAQGKYYVLLPDGRKQIVEYTADGDGFKPKVTYEQTSNAYGSGNTGYSNSYQVGTGHVEESNGGYHY